jgi:hypothetical protein
MRMVINMDSFNPKSIQTEYYGDVFRWWIGVVVNNNDPLQVGRVRVRIYGVHSDDLNLIPEEALPWAVPVIPTTEDGVSGLGRSSKLKPGAMVMGYFADGPQSQIPIVIGSIPRFAEPSPGQLGEGSRYPSSSIVPSLNAPRNKNEGEGMRGAQGQSYSTASAVGKTNTEKAFNFFVATGLLSVSHAAAICGCLIKVSNMDPKYSKSTGDRSSFGIAGWGEKFFRIDELKGFCSDRSLNVMDLESQLQFLMYDFAERMPRWFKFSQFISTQDIRTATATFLDYYLRPEKGSIDFESTLKVSKDVYETYSKA